MRPLRAPHPIWPLLVAALAGGVYLNAVGNGFALDDVPLVRDNPSIRSLERLPRLFVEPYWPESPESGLYRPLTVASYAVNRAIAGDGPMGYHAVNLLLHALVTVLAWFVARGIGVHYGTAFAAAALFAVHPLHVEAVANIAGRAELLAAAGVLGAWLAHRRARDGNVRWAIVAAACWLGALLSKEGAVLAPLIFALDDSLSDRAAGSSFAARRWIGYIAAIAAALALRFAALGGLGAARSSIFLDNPPAFLGAGTRVATALWVQCRYVGLFFWPARLSSDYSHNAIAPVDSPTDPRLAAGLGLVVLVVAMFVLGARRARPLAVGVGCWTLAFLPASNIAFPAGTVMAERLAYLPSFGLCLVAGHCLAWLADSSASRQAHANASPLASRWRAVLPVALAAGAVVALGARTVARNFDWRDNATLALHDVEVMPRSAKLQAGAGLALAAQGDAPGAEAALGRAVEIYPDYAQMHYNLGRLLAARGAQAEALVHLERAATIAPDNPLTWKSLAPLLELAGRHGEALAAWSAGARTDPADHPLRFNLGRVLVAAGRADDARSVLRELASDAAGSVAGELARGLLAELDGDVATARAIYGSLLARPDLPAGIRRNVDARLRGLPLARGRLGQF